MRILLLSREYPPHVYGGDTIVGGPGTDIWYADAADHASTVEKKIICFAD